MNTYEGCVFLYVGMFVLTGNLEYSVSHLLK